MFFAPYLNSLSISHAFYVLVCMLFQTERQLFLSPVSPHPHYNVTPPKFLHPIPSFNSHALE
ncbi:hypothetical protein MPG01_05515 [Helicobacter pylori]|nr:hypothetical protein [Helicobacter pylori]UOS11225.1 hypothetical protein MPG01_05515 [Helicobacter pylori]